MITVFFTEDGYYVTGDGVDIAQRCTPALTEQGDRIFLPQHHTYKVLYLALCELREAQVHNDIMVYNDSRIIDELNGSIGPLDTTCDEWLKTLKRDVIPTIKSVVFFRKQAASVVGAMVAYAHGDMLDQIDRRQRQVMAEKEVATQETTRKTRLQQRVERFKQSWFKGQTDGK